MTKTIDITPTWESVTPILIAALRSGTFEGQRIATEELLRMARLADETVERAKS
jgi:hypothetical protein